MKTYRLTESTKVTSSAKTLPNLSCRSVHPHSCIYPSVCDLRNILILNCSCSTYRFVQLGYVNSVNNIKCILDLLIYCNKVSFTFYSGTRSFVSYSMSRLLLYQMFCFVIVVAFILFIRESIECYYCDA